MKVKIWCGWNTDKPYVIVFDERELIPHIRRAYNIIEELGLCDVRLNNRLIQVKYRDNWFD